MPSMVEINGEYVDGVGLSADEEATVQRFLHAGRGENRTLADIIMDKINEKKDHAEIASEDNQISPKVNLILFCFCVTLNF